MTLNRVRRFSVLALALALVVGIVTHGVRAVDMDVKMTMAAASDMAMPGKCDACGSGNDKMSGVVCAVPCGGLVAIPVAADIVLSMLPVTISSWTVAPAVADWATPPDPYPPRPTVLS
ncbi:MAG: hypothetical protein GEU95_25100 [Rhizobiales bacterium]|nr:hypothetical protein [Hyphomicrobiales bacterium]